MSQPPLIFVTTPDPGVLSNKVDEVVKTLNPDPSTIVSWEPKRDELSDLLYSTSLFNDEEFILVKEPGNSEIKTLTAYLATPDPNKTIIVASVKPQVVFRRAVTKAGGQVEEIGGKYAKDIVSALIRESGLTLQPSTGNRIIDHIGEDVYQAPALLRSLADFYGDQLITIEMVEPFLSVAGGVKPWALTDAIDRGPSGIVQALEMVDRLWAHQTPVGIVSILKAHISKVWTLQQSGVSNEQDAARVLGMKGSTYPAKKALNLGRVYKGAAEDLLLMSSEVDAALRGGQNQWSGIPARLALEVLVARMCAYPRK